MTVSKIKEKLIEYQMNNINSEKCISYFLSMNHAAKIAIIILVSCLFRFQEFWKYSHMWLGVYFDLLILDCGSLKIRRSHMRQNLFFISFNETFINLRKSETRHKRNYFGILCLNPWILEHAFQVDPDVCITISKKRFGCV